MEKLIITLNPFYQNLWNWLLQWNEKFNLLRKTLGSWSMNKDGRNWKEHYGLDGIAVFLQYLNRDGWNWEEHYELDGEGHSYGEDVTYVNGSLTGKMVGKCRDHKFGTLKTIGWLGEWNKYYLEWNGHGWIEHASGLEVNWLRQSYDKGCHTRTHMHAHTKEYTCTHICTHADKYRYNQVVTIKYRYRQVVTITYWYTGTVSWVARNFNWTIAALLNFNRTILIDVEF